MLFDLQNRFDETSQKKNLQTKQLDQIKTDINLEINNYRDALKGPVDEYLCTLDRLQNQTSKLEAFSCFEDGKLDLVIITQARHFLLGARRAHNF